MNAKFALLSLFVSSLCLDATWCQATEREFNVSLLLLPEQSAIIDESASLQLSGDDEAAVRLFATLGITDNAARPMILITKSESGGRDVSFLPIGEETWSVTHHPDGWATLNWGNLKVSQKMHLDVCQTADEQGTAPSEFCAAFAGTEPASFRISLSEGASTSRTVDYATGESRIEMLLPAPSEGYVAVTKVGQRLVLVFVSRKAD